MLKTTALVLSSGFWLNAGSVVNLSDVLGWRVGNGGDPVRMVVTQARDHAAAIVGKVHPAALDGRTDVNEWIIQNRDKLAADILTSPHQFVLEEQSTCAWTQLPDIGAPIPEAKPIQFSMSTCAKTIQDVRDASRLLIHESVHHFGITDEAFADAVALTVSKAWEEGRLNWSTFTMDGDHASRSGHSAVWTGEEMIVFGGLNDRKNKTLNTGFMTDAHPDELDTIPLATKNAPARTKHTAIWTGAGMIVWGGFDVRGNRAEWRNSGAYWLAEQNKWIPIPPPTGPDDTNTYLRGEKLQTAIWTGEELIVYGGAGVQAGGLAGAYNLETKTWRELSDDGAPYIQGGHSAVWTGKEMIVWGGIDGSGRATDKGYAYNPAADRWHSISTKNAPAARSAHNAIMAGDKMFVFAGFEPSFDAAGTGGLYDPARNKWVPVTSDIAIGRTGHSMVWTGKEVLVYGGRAKRSRTAFGSVLAFDPISLEWQARTTRNQPTGRYNQAAVWTGYSLVTVGGLTGQNQSLDDGGIFIP